MRIFACDLETYVSENPNEQSETWVWSSAGAEIEGNEVFLHHSLKESFEYFQDMNDNIKVFYHNLKFDGSFWLDYLLRVLKYKQAFTKEKEWLSDKDMPNESFKYLISDMGQWYSLVIKTEKGNTIEMIDSLKIIPFTLKQAGEAFRTQHQKLDMEYKGFRNEYHVFSEEEKQYILNDVLCLKECIEFIRKQGHLKNTVGGCCMEEYKKNFLFPIFKEEYKQYYPNLYEIEIPDYISDYKTTGEYINRSYKGGWCYLRKGKENKVFENGGTFDVNSLYPSMMHSISGNKFPVYEPFFWKGNYIPDEAKLNNRFYFIRIKTRFYLKDGYLPTIQIKNNPCYKSTEYLETSDIFYGGTFHKEIYIKGKLKDTRVELVLSEIDYVLFLEHYDVVDFEILDGCYFYAISGLFDEYINHFAEIKKNEKGALRTLAKLFLNNLYGQFAKSTDSSFKHAYLNENGDICYETVKENKKIPGYIPIGSAITSYAREFTIRTAQKNYDDFIYADTDSIHMTNPEKAKGMNIHDKDFCCWKKECLWDKGIFVRQKTYVEIEENSYNIKCAGMTPVCKKIFINNLETGKNKLEDFKVGLEIKTGKLRPKRINGGIILVDTSYKIR